MSRRRPRATSRAIARVVRQGSDGREKFPWFAWLVLATMLVIGAALGRAAPAPPLPPPASQGFRPTRPTATPGQTLVPPPQHAKGGVITPPTTVDRAIATPTPPAAAFPTPIVKPPGRR